MLYLGLVKLSQLLKESILHALVRLHEFVLPSQIHGVSGAIMGEFAFEQVSGDVLPLQSQLLDGLVGRVRFLLAPLVHNNDLFWLDLALPQREIVQSAGLLLLCRAALDLASLLREVIVQVAPAHPRVNQGLVVAGWAVIGAVAVRPP